MPLRPPPVPPPTLTSVSGIGTRVSRTFEPDDPELSNKRVQAFRLHELEHIPRDHRDMHDALLRSMPEMLFEPDFTDKVSEVIERYADLKVEFFFDAVRFYETSRLRRLIPGATCLIVLGVAPRPEKIVVEVDLEFAYQVISHLLGTGTGGFDVHRPLTEIEQGVFLFIALKVLAIFDGGWVNPEQLAIRIEDIRSDIRSSADVFRPEHRWLCASWKLSYDMDIGSIRVFLPESLAKVVCFTPPAPDSELARRTRERVRQRLKAYGDVPVEAWIETGRIELSKPDLEELEPGDIVLLEDTELQLENGMARGPAVMRIGLGQRGKLLGELHLQDDKQVFEIQQIVVEQMPNVHDPIQGHGEFENPEQLVAEYEDRSHQEGDYDQEDSYESGAEEYAYPDEEGDNGVVTADDVYDEDIGLDDENDGDDEQYGDYEEGDYEEGDYEEGDYEEGGYEEGGYEEGEHDEHLTPVEPDNLIEAEPLLGDIPMIAVVELGRVQLTADEVVRLRSGQLVELGRSPTDPVDLVVNGKLVAKGELVEIEGALGVKLVSLTKGEE